MANIHHELFIGTTAEKIYNALTSETGLSSWWTPQTKANDKLGTVLRFTFQTGYHKEMKIVELSPFDRVKWICIAGANEWVGTNISFTLENANKETLLSLHPEIDDQLRQSTIHSNGTLLIFHHNDWKEYTPMFAECNYTWGLFLRSLKLFCETGKGTPWPNQHQI